MVWPLLGETPRRMELCWAAETWGSWLEGEGSRGPMATPGAKLSGQAQRAVWNSSQSGTIHDLAQLVTWRGPRFGTAHDLARLTAWHSP